MTTTDEGCAATGSNLCRGSLQSCSVLFKSIRVLWQDQTTTVANGNLLKLRVSGMTLRLPIILEAMFESGATNHNFRQNVLN